MTRQEFLRRMIALGALGAVGLLERKAWILEAQVPGKSPGPGPGLPGLVAVKGGDQAARLDRGIKEYGGMASFVRKGQTVVIKPNIGWSQDPSFAATTNPLLIKRLVEHCLDAGAKKVWVFDHTCDNGPRSYKASQIEAYAREGGAQVVAGDNSSSYQDLSLPKAILLKKTKVHELILAADVFINVPVLKSHSGEGMTCAMKNLMGMVWNREEFHSLGLDACIADSGLARRPDLNIVDAARIMLSGGPRGYASSQYDEQQMLLLSTDPVACDAVAARTLGKDPKAFGYIARGAEGGLGIDDLQKLDIRRLRI